MEITQHTSHDYRPWQPAELVPFGNNVVTQTTANVGTFGAPSTPLVIALGIALGILTTKNAAYLTNPKVHAAMETQRKVVVKIMNQLNQVVDGVAAGDGGIIDLSGFNKTAGETVKGQKPGICVIHDMYPEVAKGGYYVQVDAMVKCTFIFIVCSLAAVVTFSGNQYNVSTGPFSVITDTHPHADFLNLVSGDQKLVIIAVNPAGMGTPTAPVTISVP